MFIAETAARKSATINTSHGCPKTSHRDRSRSTHGRRLSLQPEGLADGIEVTVLSYDRRTYNHVVRDPEGREWTIQALQNLDAGSEYLLGARWLPGDHPLVLAELKKSFGQFERFMTKKTTRKRKTRKRRYADYMKITPREWAQRCRRGIEWARRP